MRKHTISVLFWLMTASTAYAIPSFQSEIPEAKAVGTGRYSMLLWDVYDATLYAPKGAWDPKLPCAITMHYLRDVDGSDIAEHTLKDIRHQGITDQAKLHRWYEQIKASVPDVDEGSEFSMIFIPGKFTYFYHDNALVGTITDTEFSQVLLDIWLGEKTGQPELRQKLLGES